MTDSDLLLKKLIGRGVSLTVEEMDACLDLFRADATGEQAYIPEYFYFHYYCAKHGDPAHAHEEQNIRQNYIYRLRKQRNPDTEALNTLYINSAEYYYSMHVYSECIRCLFLVLENKSSLPRYLSIATSILFSVLAESGLYEQCYPYLERLEAVFAEHPAPPQTMFIQEMSFMQLYGFSGRLEEAETYYNKLKNEPLPEGFGEADLAYLELLHLSIEAVNRQGTEPRADYAACVAEVCGALSNDTGFQDSNYSVTLLPILRYMRPYAPDDQLLALYTCFEKFVYAPFDRLALYTYLFEEAGIAPETAPGLHTSYIRTLKLYYSKDQSNRRQLVETALLTQAIETEYRQKALTDRLTGLGNRQAYTELFQFHITAPGAPEPGLCLVMMDLDDLKKQNDCFGHEAGDRLIRGAAVTIRKAFGKEVDLFRFGGDEFIALLDTDAETVEATLRRLGEECLAWTHSKENPNGAVLSISSGYAFVAEVGPFEDNAEKLRAVYELADRRMYAEKKRRHSSDGTK